MPTPSDVAIPARPSAADAAPDGGEAVDHALARSVLYGAVARAFHPPHIRLAGPLAKQAIREAASLVDGATGHLREAAERFIRGVGAESADDRAERFARLFGHTTRGAVCVYETEYGAETLYGQPHTLADIAGYYRAFGLHAAGFARERSDHVGCECAFVEFLSLKEAYCLDSISRGVTAGAEAAEETLEETRRAARPFLRDHLARFGAAFARSTIRADPDGFYGAAAAVLLRLLEIDSERLEIPLGPATLELRSTADDHVPAACGREPELLQIQRSRSVLTISQRHSTE
jgi:TorA maturation chaperone TorD